MYKNVGIGNDLVLVESLYTCCGCQDNSDCTETVEAGSFSLISTLQPGRYTLLLQRGSVTLAASPTIEIVPDLNVDGNGDQSESQAFSFVGSCSDNWKSENLLQDRRCRNPADKFQCADDEFCFCAAVAHESAALFGCCDEFSSCRATRDVKSDLARLERISKADFAFSLFIIALSLCKFGDATAPVGSIIIVFIFLDFCFSAGIIAAINRSTIPNYAQDLITAECFTNRGNEQSLADFKSEIQSFRNLAIAEIVMSFFVIFVHLADLADGEVAGYSIVAWILDFIELVLAGVGLFNYLLAAIDGFKTLHESMMMTEFPDGDVISIGEPLPCILSSCGSV